MIGLISGSLGVAALLGVLFFPWLQRRIGRDTQLIVACAVLASLCLAGFVLAGDPVLKMALLFLANFFVLGTLPLFWSVAMSRMSGLMAAVGLAFVNMIGLTGSFVGPSVFGALESSGSSFPFVLGSCLAGVVVAVGLAAVVRRERPVEVGGSR
jgi:predicted MFS family arabinose efflux permease